MEDVVFEFAFERGHGEELEVDGTAVAVVVAGVGYARTDGGANPQFFLKFAREGLLGGFAGLDLSAGNLPLQRHWLIGAALADEYEAVADQQPSYNETERGARWAR